MIAVNRVYSFGPTGKLFRVLHVSPDDDLAIVIRLQTLSARPKRLSLSRLTQLLGSNELIPVTMEVDEISVDEAGAAAQTRFKAIENEILAIINLGAIGLSEKPLWSIIVPAAGRCGMTPHGFNAALTRALQAGLRVIAALPRWDKCGRAASIVKGAAILRPTNQPKAFPLSVAELTSIKDGVRRFKKGSATWDEAHQEFLKHCYPLRIEIINGERITITKPALQCPSLGQFYRHGKKSLGFLGNLRSAVGEHEIQLNHRGKPNGQSAGALLPSLEGEIDWTFTDLVLVRRGNRLSIGRLVVYVIVDRFSGMILSIYLTLSTGRYEEAARAILVCLEDKVELCARYGKTIRTADWPVFHIPWIMYSDRGEVDSWNGTSLASGLGIKLIAAPGRRGDCKGGIESAMEQIRRLLGRMQGATTGFKERCKVNPNITATYDFDQLYRILLCFAVWRNKRIRKEQPMTKGMIAGGILPVPIHAWNWGSEGGCLREFALEAARIHTLPHHEASVTETGIRIGGLNFEVPNFDPDSPGSIDANEWLAIARKRRFAADLLIDPSTVSFVWLRHKPPGHPPMLLKCPLSGRHAAHANLSWQEYRLLCEDISQNLDHYRKNELRLATAEFRCVLKRTKDEANEMTRVARQGMSRAEQTRGIGENRVGEMLISAPTTPINDPPAQPLVAFTPFFDPAVWGHLNHDASAIASHST